jgi:hypothetical protein
VFTLRESGYVKVSGFSKSTPAVAADTTPLLALRSPVSEAMVSAGVVRVPFEAMVVVPVAPKATVFAERFVVDALLRVVLPVTVRVPLLVVFAKPLVPVKVGLFEKTATPPPADPVSSVKRPARSADVWRLVLER